MTTMMDIMDLYAFPLSWILRMCIYLSPTGVSILILIGLVTILFFLYNLCIGCFAKWNIGTESDPNYDLPPRMRIYPRRDHNNLDERLRARRNAHHRINYSSN